MALMVFLIVVLLDVGLQIVAVASHNNDKPLSSLDEVL